MDSECWAAWAATRATYWPVGHARARHHRDDIDGALYPKAHRQIALVLFDTVPGGAGGVLRIARAFPQVLATALRRVTRCDCGEEISCYGCLRNFRNQTVHDQLTRGAALNFLGRLV
jgi:ATP-dependent helicase YprA (DUF1998 family)